MTKYDITKRNAYILMVGIVKKLYEDGKTASEIAEITKQPLESIEEIIGIIVLAKHNEKLINKMMG